MSIRQRVANRIYRQESAVRDPFSELGLGTGKNAPPSHVSELITQNVKNRDDRIHQRKLALYSPIAYNLTIKLAQNAFDDGWEMVDDDGKPVQPDIMRQHRELNSQYYLTQALILERIYGHSWLYVGPEKLREDVVVDSEFPRRIANLDVFSPENSKVIEYDQYGNPSVIEVTVLKGIGPNQTQEEKKQIKRKDLILFRTRPRPFDRSYQGVPLLYPVWNMLISLERTFHASDFYNGKIGHGMFMVKTKGGMNDEKMARLETTMEEGSVSRIVILDGRSIEDIGFINATGSVVDFPREIDSRLGIIAAGLGIPKDILIGLSAGAITGSEQNVKSLFQAINQIQTSVEPPMRELDLKLGATGDYSYRWIRRYAHDEESQSKIRMNEAQTNVINLQLMTVNEVRAEQGLPPVEGGDIVLSLKEETNRIDVVTSEEQAPEEGEEFQTAEEDDATNNPGGENL